MELLRDGTGTAEEHGYKGNITWKVEKGCLHVHVDENNTAVWAYKISGSTLTLETIPLTPGSGRHGGTFKKQ